MYVSVTTCLCVECLFKDTHETVRLADQGRETR